MHFPTLLALAFLTLGSPGQPDKFWLDEAPAVEGSAPCLIEGVLLDQDETHYHVRVEAGEVWLAKAEVRRVEKDPLTVAQVERAEAEARERRAAEAHNEAAAAKAAAKAAAEASAKAADAEAAEAAEAVATEGVDALPPFVELPPLPPAPEPHYDPVLHVVRTGHEQDAATLQRDLEVAYELTRDRRYIKLVRKLRRLR